MRTRSERAESRASAILTGEKYRVEPLSRLKALAAERIADKLGLPVPVEPFVYMLQCTVPAPVVMRAGRALAKGGWFDYLKNLAAGDTLLVFSNVRPDAIARGRALDKNSPLGSLMDPITLRTQRIYCESGYPHGGVLTINV